jgi:hypothetical protein
MVKVLTDGIAGLVIEVNRSNGLVNMTVPANVMIWLPEPVRYLLGIDDDDWLDAGEYEGDRAVDFSPKKILVYLKQLSTSHNFSSDGERLVPSQLMAIIPIPTVAFGRSFTITLAKPQFKLLHSGDISELDFDFKVEWGNGKKDKLDNHTQPIDLVLEIK